MENLFETEKGRSKVLSRFSAFNNIGTDLRGITDFNSALALSDLDYSATKEDMFLANGKKIEGKFCNIKTGSDIQLGIIGNNYCTLGNREAFGVAEELVKTDLKFEAGGPCIGAKEKVDYSRAFLVLRGEDVTIGDDLFNSFVIFRNSFDGTTGVQYKIILQRLICLNGVVRYLGGKKSQIWMNLQHSSQLEGKIKIANDAVRNRQHEISMIRKEYDLFSGIKFTRDDYTNKIIPFVLKTMKLIPEDTTQERTRGEERIEKIVQKLISAYDAEDTANYNGTAYKVLLAMSDFETHYEPLRDTQNPQVYFNRVLQNMVVTSAVARFVAVTNGLAVL